MLAAQLLFASVLLAQDNPRPALPEGNLLAKSLLGKQRAREEVLNGYAYDILEVREELDGKGRATRRRSRLYHVFHVQGRPLRRLVAENGHPLSTKRQAKEDDRVRELASAISSNRAVVEQPGVRLSGILERYDFRTLGREAVEGRPAFVLEFVPKPGKRALESDQILRKLTGKLWVDEAEGELVSIELANTSGIKFALGLGASVSGLTLRMEFRKADDLVWLPHRLAVDVSGRKLLLKGFRIRATALYGPYRRFQVDSDEVLTPLTPASPRPPLP